MIFQLSLFDVSDIDKYEVGSDEWKFNKYVELSVLSMKELEDIQSDIYFRYSLRNNWFNDEDYYTDIVIIDLLQSVHIQEFQRKYPKALVYYRVPKYLDENLVDKDKVN